MTKVQLPLDLSGLASKLSPPSESSQDDGGARAIALAAIVDPLDPSIMAKSSRPTAKPTATPSRRGGAAPPRGGNGSSDGSDGGGEGELDASLQAETRRRYLNYALSVITSRALPDVRDGLKPVQRRILYAMLNDEHLRPDAKHRKSAKVVGSVLGRYHPHGDSSVYDAMVRMAQSWALRMPLVDGSGNFGSLDGDSAAAYRYTECRLAPAAMELLRELDQETVDWRANYDGTTEEPVVLPARYPNLLVNGATGIAVGMATSIPPHNLKEVTAALVALIDDRDLTTTNLMKHILGPDFPTGGQLLNSKVELRQIYETGQGALRVRAEHKLEEKKRGGTDIIVTSIPYALSKSDVVEKIAEVILGKKLPQLIDVRDESTTDVRIVLELKKDAEPAMVMAYLYKHTPLQLNFSMNLTCLVPFSSSTRGSADGTAGGEGPMQPQRLGIKEVLLHFLDFRLEVTRKRYEHELRQLQRRIHILEAFIKIFNALDETIKIIRASDGKEDAAQKLMKRFGLDAEQVEAILEMKLYKLAKLEINILREEHGDKIIAARKIEAILKSPKKLSDVVRGELEAVAMEYGTPRLTRSAGNVEEIEFDADAFIVDEDANVVVTRDGWLKRVRELKDPTATRVRESDVVTAVLPGSTREKVVFFTNRGSAYVAKINDISPTAGYGDPAQKYFKFADGERIVCAMTLDPRAMLPETLLAVTKRGYGLRFALAPQAEMTTRAGRRYAKPQEGDEVVGVLGCAEADTVVVATRNAYVLVCKAAEIAKLENPGRGVVIIKAADDDEVVGFVAGGKTDILELETEGGKKLTQPADPKQAKGRGGKGHQVIKRTTVTVAPRPVTIVALATADGGAGVH